ncbi:WD40 repeat [Fusarium albosuccineum]|uniref:WD40 repeat n=1 Tax=Fusarium albosuccineum TaxID=1237068 RepID=A0A8H4LGH0_9HYPO|nr:WD40 repeat [Fusarium albosuccineum]
MGELGTFPPGLEPLYTRMLKQVQTARKDRSNIYYKVIYVILTVFRPISLDELGPLAEVPAAASDDESLTDIIELCGSFLTIQQRTVYFVHDSAKGFLMNSASNFQYDAEEQHHLVFSTSLNIISTSLRRDILGQESSEAKPMEKTLAPLRYPCTRWVFHLTRCASDALVAELADDGPLDWFLRKNYLHWLEVLGHMSFISAGILSMMELERILQNHTSRLADLARDESRFIRYHRPGIEQSPHLVSSALVFSPNCSITRDVYQQEQPNWTTLKPRVEDYWSPGLHSMEGHTRGVEAISFSHDGRLLVSGSSDHTVIVWDVITGEPINRLRGHTGGLTSLAFSGIDYRVALASKDGTIMIWDAEQSRCVWALKDHENPQIDVLSVAFSQDGRLLAAGSSDREIGLWDPETRLHLQTLLHTPPMEDFKGREEPAMSVAISRHNRFLASSDGSTTCIWNLKSGIRLHEIRCNFFHAMPFVTFSSKNELAMIDGNTFKILDPVSAKCLKVHRTGTNTSSYSLSFSPDGNFLALGRFSNSITIFDTTTWDRVQELKETASSVLFSPSGNLLASVRDERIKIWDLNIRNPAKTTRFNEAIRSWDVNFISFSPDGSLVVFGSEDRQPTLWDSMTGEYARTIQSSDECGAFTPTFSSDSRLIAFLNTRDFLVEETKTGVKCMVVSEQTLSKQTSEPYDDDRICSAAFSPDNRRIVILMRSGYFHILDIQSGRSIQRLKSKRSYISSLAFSHDGLCLAVSHPGYIELWDTTLWEHKQLLNLPVKSDVIRGLVSVFSKDNVWIAHGTYTRGETRINILSLLHGTCVQTFDIRGSCTVQSFDPTCLRIETDMGTFDLVEGEPRPKSYRISKDGQWIPRGTERVLWLPPEFRPDDPLKCCTVFSGSKIAFSLPSGGVLIVGFAPDGPAMVSQELSFSPPALVSCPATRLADQILVPTKRRHSQTN